MSAAYYDSTSKLGLNLLLGDGQYVAERLPERVWGYEFQVDYQVTNSFVLNHHQDRDRQFPGLFCNIQISKE